MDMLEEKESERALFGDDLCAWRRGVDVMCWRSGTVVWAVDEEREGSFYVICGVAESGDGETAEVRERSGAGAICENDHAACQDGARIPASMSKGNNPVRCR